MGKKKEIITQSIKILNTGQECLQYIEEKIEENKLKESLNIFKDFVEGITSVDQVISKIMGKKKKDQIPSWEDFEENLEMMVSAYENPKEYDPEYILKNLLIPQYQKWFEEVKQMEERFEN